ncbi:MAG TPA: NAD-dependent epimerase/dehydratase family protein [Thermoleophilaceae bacterium]|nr:NAD-dependent epimerase/dehydratase family protein [Thermoleophilaceae bacterium]
MAAVILVTGGAGFIGSHIVDALRADGRDVRVLDVRERGDDVRDLATVERYLDGVTAVCHQAAMVGLGVDMADITDFVAHNDLGTATLLKALAARRFRGGLVLASSMVVYGEGRYACAAHGELAAPPRVPGDLEAGRFDPRCPDCGGPLEPLAVSEDAPLRPASVYAATKVHQEHLCFAFARETGVPVTALRYHNVYGPRMPRDTPYAGVAAIFMSSLARGEPPRVFEDGHQRRDFVHVRDVARANVRALTGEPYDGALNVASGRPRTVHEMADALTDAFGRDAPRPVTTGQWRAGDVRHVFASSERAAAELGFRAEEPFTQGMGELVNER